MISPILSAFYLVTIGWMNISPLLLVELITVVSFWLAAALMYYCALKITGNILGSVMAGVVYALAQVFLSQITEMHYFFLIGYALFPLLFIGILLVIRDHEKKWVLILPVIVIIIGSVADPQYVLLGAAFLLLFIPIYALRQKDVQLSTRLMEIGFGMIIIVLFMLPTIMMLNTGGAPSLLSTHYTLQDASSDSSYSLFNAFVLSSSENTFIFGASSGQWTVPGFLWPIGMAIALIVPLIALTSLRLKNSRLLTIALLVPALLFVVVANGPHAPFGGLFTWAFEHVPLMDTVRSYSRFLFFTAFAYAIMIALVFANIDIAWPKSKGGRKKSSLKTAIVSHKRETLAILVIVAVAFPSSAIFIEPRAFNLPTSYSAPYVWLDDQNGDYRVLNLPMETYYTSNGTGGYPLTTTLDPGDYSPLISNTEFTYGTDTSTFWKFINSSAANEEVGYKNIAALLGGAASVKYIVAQCFVNNTITDAYLVMNNVSLEESFYGGSAIYLNGEWEERVHTLSSIVAATGGLSSILTAANMGLNLSTTGVVLVSDL